MPTRLHVELSTRCVLACPACPRTWFAETFGRPIPRHDLDLDIFQRFLDCDSGRAITHFHLEGNHSDSIYAPQLFDFIDRWRDSKTFHIVTNGSRMKSDFWRELAARLGPKDRIEFSIDGLESTNHIYRINSEWSSIMQALDILSYAAIPITWKTIIFRHNQDQIDDIRRLAAEKGADRFQLVKTHRFGGDQFVPDADLIDSARTYENSQSVAKIDPACDRGGQLYVTPDHYAWPCCWISAYRTLHQTALWRDRQIWSMLDKDLDQILDSNQVWAGSIKVAPLDSHAVCRMMCSG